MMKFGSTIWRNLRETLSDRYEPEHIRSLADLYWRTLLVTAFVVLVFVFLYSTWGLLRVLNNLSATLDTSAPPPPALNRSLLNATVRAFEDRKTRFEELKANPPAPVKDPSR